MHFSNLNRKICAYICTEDTGVSNLAKTLLDDDICFDCARQDADIFVGDVLPQAYDVTQDVPFLCLDQTMKTDRCFVYDGKQQSICAWLDAATMAGTKEELFAKMPFAAVCALDDEQGAQKLYDIIHDDERLGALGITQRCDVQNCCMCVVFLQESMLHDAELAAWCAALPVPVMAILEDGVQLQQATAFFEGFACVCYDYDLWQINEAVYRLSNMDAIAQDRDYYAGLAALYGVGRVRDVKRGTQLLKRSAQMGNVRAMLNRSICRMYAVGEHCDMVKSQRMLQQAAQSLLEQKQDRDLAQIIDLAAVSQDVFESFIAHGDVQQARVVATQAYRLCAEYLKQDDNDRAKLACAACALQAANIALDMGDMTAYAQMYLAYADLTYQARGALNVTRRVCDEILACLDTIAGHLAKDEENLGDALRCADVGVCWQQYVFDTWQDDAARAALASYLELRGELYCKNKDARAIDDYRACITLSQDYVSQSDRAARFHAKSFLALGKALYACENFDEACQAFETAQELWRELYDRGADAACASQLCAAAQGRAMAAAACDADDALTLSEFAINLCAGLADTFRATSVWESLANSYGVRAKLTSPDQDSIAFYNKEASIWHQLHVLTYEDVYAQRQRQALALAREDEQRLSPPGTWQKFLNRTVRRRKNEEKTEDKTEE